MKPRIDRATAKQYLARKRLRMIRAESAAAEVRFELMSAIEQSRPPELDDDTIRLARHAAPYGEFPSHTALMLCYDHVL